MVTSSPDVTTDDEAHCAVTGDPAVRLELVLSHEKTLTPSASTSTPDGDYRHGVNASVCHWLTEREPFKRERNGALRAQLSHGFISGSELRIALALVHSTDHMDRGVSRL